MTVRELIERLTHYPPDMEVQTATETTDNPVDGIDIVDGVVLLELPAWRTS
jgi:hypothetical protein